MAPKPAAESSTRTSPSRSRPWLMGSGGDAGTGALDPLGAVLRPERREHDAHSDEDEDEDHASSVRARSHCFNYGLSALPIGSTYDPAAAALRARRGPPRLVLARRREPLPGPALALRAGPPARGGARGVAVRASGAGARAHRGGPAVPARGRARPGRDRARARGGRRGPGAARRDHHLRDL